MFADFTTILVLLFGVLTAGQDIPDTPCPEVFRYDKTPDGNVFGRISIPYDGSTKLQLMVNASMKGYYTNKNSVKLTIKMGTPGQDLLRRKTDNVNYEVYFPFQTAIPKITTILYNKREYCTGPPEDLLPGTPGITSIWSGHNYFFRSPSIPTSTEPQRPLGENSTEAPAQRSSPSIPIQCGVSNAELVPLIIGGQEIGERMFPWLVAMFTVDAKGYQYKCVANLVTDRHVITAARCVNYFKVQVVRTEDILLVLGKRNLKNWATSGAVIRSAAAVHTNPEYEANSGHWDIAIIAMDQPVEFGPTIAPICLWEGDESIDAWVNQTGVVAGWGADEAAQKLQRHTVAKAKSVDLPIVAEDRCLYSNFTYYQLTSELTFCAGSRDGTGVCVGDSGAGFLINVNGRYYLRGVTSIILTDKIKCDLSNYMVFCDAAKVVGWIKKYIDI